MKKIIKLTAWILLTAMILSALACAKASEDDSVATTAANNNAATTTQASETIPEETADPNTVPDIPDTKYTGFTYRVANGFVGDTKYTTDSMFNYDITAKFWRMRSIPEL